jgi:hypothetical protein
MDINMAKLVFVLLLLLAATVQQRRAVDPREYIHSVFGEN